MTPNAPQSQQPMILASQGIVVPVEHREHGGYSTAGTGNSTAGNPSMLTRFFSR
jgi:hypothetical protein